MSRRLFSGLLVLVFVDVCIAAARLKTRPGTRRKPSANETFFGGRFNPCKGTRLGNPVELVRAHVFATKLFNAIGIKQLVRIATKYRVPAYALYPLGDFACRGQLILYAHFSKRQDLMLTKDRRPEAYLSFVLQVFSVFEKSFPYLVLRSGDKVFKLPWIAAKEAAILVFPEILKIGDGHPPRDVNFMLHAIEHVRVILL